VAANDAMTGVRNMVKKNPDDYPALKKVFEDAEPKVKLFPPLRSELSNYKQEAIAREQKAASNADNMKLLQDVQQAVEDPAKRQTVRVLLDRARVVANSMGKEYADEVLKVQQKLTLYTLKDGVDAAKAKEASGDLPGALAAYDEAVIRFNKEFDKTGGKAETPDILNLYKELIAESNRLVDRVETPEFEAAVPERDMLSAKERAAWGKSLGAEFTFAARELEMKGVEVPGKKILGVVSFAGWDPPWHDIVMDMNFTIVQGSFELYLRYHPAKRWFTLNFDQKAGYELNKPYQITLRIKGSKVELTAPDQQPQTDMLTENTNRTGGIGFGLAPGSKVIISSCKVKVLRPRT
jgi:hypothetical protein